MPVPRDPRHRGAPVPELARRDASWPCSIRRRRGRPAGASRLGLRPGARRARGHRQVRDERRRARVEGGAV
eukprot:scaffold3275_cov385-Prasinococcus_capsulatus_cf.AAC.5